MTPRIEPGWAGPGALLDFEVKGIPAPQGSKRYLGVSSRGKVRMAESSDRVAPWRADVRAAAEQAMAFQSANGAPEHRTLWAGSVMIKMIFHLPRPRSHYGTGRNADILKSTAPRYPAGTPDLDKLVRAVLDALTGVVWKDDGQVVGIYTTKLYAHREQPPGMTAHVKEA